MGLAHYFPLWDRLTAAEQKTLERSAVKRAVPEGTLLSGGAADCAGLFVIRRGRLRVFIISDEGKEVTIYRLSEKDMCLFSASCMMQNIRFDVTVEAEKDSELWIIPADVYKKLMDSSAAVANYTSQIMALRFSEVMWLMEQIMWKSFDKRLAAFLLEESAFGGGGTLKITHEKIANHMGTAREVVTRMLSYFQSEGTVRLSRGTIELTDLKRLQALSEQTKDTARKLPELSGSGPS